MVLRVTAICTCSKVVNVKIALPVSFFGGFCGLIIALSEVGGCCNCT